MIRSNLIFSICHGRPYTREQVMLITRRNISIIGLGLILSTSGPPGCGPLDPLANLGPGASAPVGSLSQAEGLGKDGDLVVSMASTVVNRYAVLAADAKQGDTMLTLSGTGGLGLDGVYDLRGVTFARGPSADDPTAVSGRIGVTGGRFKAVSYWVGRAVGSEDVSGYRPNAEIDKVAWFPYDEALRRLSYDRDRDTLREAYPLRRKTHAVVVLRHGQARSRKSWRRHDDRLRPLLQSGRLQAQRLIPLLAAYDAVADLLGYDRTARPTAETGPPELHALVTGHPGTARAVAELLGAAAG